VPDQTLDLYALNGRKRHTFSAALDEMEPASCCFGSGDQGWRPFTLYILMRSGDVYALSPLVPSRWQVPRVYTQALSLDITAQMEAFTEETTSEERLVVRHQTKWINDVLNQQQNLLDAQTSFATPKGHVPTCLTRPQVVGPSPELQGPFVFEPAPPQSDSDDCFAACDIFHMEAGPVGVIGIIHSNGKLDIYIEPEPVTAKWYKKGPTAKGEPPMLAHFDRQDLQISAGQYSESTSWPTFTKDPHSTQLWFVNHLSGVTAFSLKPWLSHLAAGLEEEEDLLQLLANSPKTQLQNIVDTARNAVDGTLVVYEAYIGYLLIASHAAGLSSVEFDEPLAAEAFLPDDDTSFTLQAPIRRYTGDLAATPRATRFLPAPSATPPPPATTPPPQPISILQPPFVPSAEFSKPSQLPTLLRGIKDAKKPVMFSAQSLTAFKQARDTLKSEFDALMAGAQEMYDRAAAQRLEYHKQLETLNAIYQRVGNVRDRGVKERLERFVERQEQMQKRAEGMLRELITKNVVGLSDAEKKWGREVERMMERVVGEAKGAFGSRTLRAGEMVQELMPIAAEEAEEEEKVKDDVPKEVREGKIKQLRELLDRE
jgi:nucleoporin NUP82